jgi:hypothetical protein
MVAKGGVGIPEYILEDSLFMPSLSSLSSSARLKLYHEWSWPILFLNEVKPLAPLPTLPQRSLDIPEAKSCQSIQSQYSTPCRIRPPESPETTKKTRQLLCKEINK